MIDCFVSEFSKKRGILCANKQLVHKSYKNNLNAYHGKYFSIFKRTERINVEYNGKVLNTTIAQLNFFRWIIENKILNKIEQYYDDLCTELTKRTAEKGEPAKKGETVEKGKKSKKIQNPPEIHYNIKKTNERDGSFDIIINIQ
jgi:hypothetical protein